MAHIAAPALLVMGSLVQGVSEKKAQDRNAATHEENARLAILQGEQSSLNVYRDERQAIGDSLAASGSMMGGSIEMLVRESARQAELEVARVREQARGEAINSKAQARAAKTAGRSALVGSLFNAASSALGASSAMRDQRLRSDAAERARAAERSGG